MTLADNAEPHQPWILDTAAPPDRHRLVDLRADAAVQVIDRVDAQRAGLDRLLPPPADTLRDEPTRWVYYPWRRTLVHVLGPLGFRRLRLDRNRHMITAAEQDRLLTKQVGVVGLSVGHVIAHTLAAEGLCGRLRLADFDELELSNLNRVPATVFDLGVNKAVVTARRIAELDPYVEVEVIPTGLTVDGMDAFLSGLDIVVEECDSLDMKALLRRAARAHGLPVVMATSDRGLVDVERFDTEPDRPILHGLLDESLIDQLAGLTPQQKIAHVLRIVDAGQGSARGAASMVEVGRSIATWPQLAGDVVLGATAVAEAVRRIGLGAPLRSGRVRIDISDALDLLADPVPPQTAAPPDADDRPAVPTDPVAAISTAARWAPSAGNAQPWRIESDITSITISIDPDRSPVLDPHHRSSAVAVGAAVFNAQVAAAAHQMLGPVQWSTAEAETPLRATMKFANATDPGLAAMFAGVWDRGTNRRGGSGGTLHTDIAVALTETAAAHGARLHLLTEHAQLDRAAAIMADADRIRFLTPHLHAEMVSEVRFPGVDDLSAGLDVRTLELDPGEHAALEILRRPEVMAHLADWDAGGSLGAMTRSRVLSSSALGVLTVTGQSLVDYARGGMAAEAVWVVANQAGMAVQPVTPLFTYALSTAERQELSPRFASALGSLASAFDDLIRPESDETLVIVFRFAASAPASVRSRRRQPSR